MKNHCYIFFCALTTLALTMRLEAQSLYATTAAGGSGELYILNPSNGSMVSDVGPLNDSLGANYGITGLAFNPVTGVLYGSTANSNPLTAAQLVSINYNSGLVTVIGSFNAGPVNGSGTPATMADLAFDAAGNLYGIGSIGGPQLYSINSFTGQATLIGGTGLTSTTGGGLAISAGGSFYGTPTSTRFGTYDPTLGTYANIANPTRPAGGAYASLSFDANGVLFGINLGSGSPPSTHLVTFNLATGAITDLGASLNSIDAIAFQPVPEPGTLAILGGGVLALLVNVRRYKKLVRSLKALAFRR